MNHVLELFQQYHATPSDINEHLPVLLEYSRGLKHITEMGTRDGVSTTALLLAKPEKLITYDIEITDKARKLFASRPKEIEWIFYQQSTLEPFPCEETELLFIDTWHNYDQLIKELMIHGNQASKYIIMHDTETYKWVGDPSDKAGLWPAIEAFLANNKHWTMKEHHSNNNGLTILERVSA